MTETSAGAGEGVQTRPAGGPAAAAGAGRGWRRWLTTGARGLRTEYAGLAVIVVAQAAWLAVLAARGWFYTDDFQDLAQAIHARLGPSYLTKPFNDHLSPGVRLVFWLVERGIGLHYGPTIALRVLLQAIATVLLYRLLRLLSSSVRLVLVVTAVYAFSPLLVPGTLWLTTAITVQFPQVFTILAFDAHVRHVRTRSWRWAAVAGLALLLGAAFWEKSGITAVLLVILSLGWLHTGGLGQRLRGMLRDWRGWLLTIGPLLGFAAYDVASGHARSATGLPVSTALHLIWLQWSQSVWPAAIGGPWHWYSGGSVYQSNASPGNVVIVLGEVAFVALAAVGWRRNRWAGLLAWLLPLTSVALGIVLVGVGRYTTFHDLIAVDYHYAYDVAIPMALAAVLSLSRPVHPVQRHVRFPRLLRSGRRVVAVAAAAALAASAVVSAVAWTNRWHASPAHDYTSTLVRSVRALGPDATVYNTPVSLRVLPFVEGDRRIGDLLALAGVPVHLNNGPVAAQLVNDRGHVVPATFVPTSVGRGTGNSFCPNLLRGTTPLVIPLKHPAGPNEYFLRLTYFQNRPTRILVAVTDSTGASIPVTGSSLALDAPVGQVVLNLGYGRPSTVTVRDTDPETNTCMSKVDIGVPLATP